MIGELVKGGGSSSGTTRRSLGGSWMEGQVGSKKRAQTGFRNTALHLLPCRACLIASLVANDSKAWTRKLKDVPDSSSETVHGIQSPSINGASSLDLTLVYNMRL